MWLPSTRALPSDGAELIDRTDPSHPADPAESLDRTKISGDDPRTERPKSSRARGAVAGWVVGGGGGVVVVVVGACVVAGRVVVGAGAGVVAGARVVAGRLVVGGGLVVEVWVLGLGSVRGLDSVLGLCWVLDDDVEDVVVGVGADPVIEEPGVALASTEDPGAFVVEGATVDGACASAEKAKVSGAGSGGTKAKPADAVNAVATTAVGSALATFATVATAGISNSQASGPAERRLPMETLRKARTMAGSNCLPDTATNSRRAASVDMASL